nr:cilia- and flagella-associated protein 57-like [Physcomitrium patens]|eukprot:XP_024385735.1 cilia- and flagella-associated protein 57-like [Physcomitrella patens]
MSSKQYNNYNASIVNGRLILPIVMISSFGCQATGLFHEVKLFAASVVKVCLSSDNFLFCASEDGLIMMFDVRIPGPQHHRWSDDVLIPKASLEDYMRRVQGLEIQAVHTEKLCEQRVKSNCDRLDEEIEDIKKQYEHTVDVARDELLALSMEKSAMELNAERKQKDVQAIHAQHLKDMEDVYNRMTVVEISRYDEFVRSKDAAIIRWTQQMKSLSKEHEVALQELMEACEAKLEDSREVLKKSKETKEETTFNLEEIRKVLEEDINLEIDEKREQYELKLMIAEEEIQKVLGENGILKYKFGLFQKDVDMSFAELSELVNQKKELFEIIRHCQHNIQMLEKNLEESEELLQEKNKRINGLKRANQELEKFKWILDYKLKDLKESIKPSRIQAAELTERIGKMENELIRARHISKDKELMLRSLKAKLHAAGVEKQRMLLSISKTTQDFRNFQIDFHELSQKNESVRVLKKELLKVFRKHVKGKLGVRNFERSPEDGAFFQRELLERKVKSLEHDIEKERKNNNRLRLRLVKDNQYLVEYTEELREEVRSRERTPMTSAASSRFSSRPTTSDGKDQLSSMRKQVAELQLQLSARCAQVELLQEQLDSSLDGELRQCVDVRKLPSTRR